MSFISQFMGFGLATTSLPTTDSVQKGDLIAQGVDGNAYWCADPTVPVYPVTRPLSNPTQIHMQMGAQNAALGANHANTTQGQPMAVLSNNNVVFVWKDYSTLLYYFSIYDAAGNLIVGPVNFGSGGGTTNLTPAVVATSGGGFVVLWYSSPNVLQAATYTNLGANVIPATTIATTSGNHTTGVQAVQLANGNVAYVAIVTVGSNYNLYTGVFTPALVQIAAMGSAYSSQPSMQYALAASLSICALTGGGYVITGCPASGIYGYCYVMSSGGTYVGQRQVGASSFAPIAATVVALPGGGFAYVFNSTSTGASIVAGVCNASGVIQGSEATYSVGSGQAVSVAVLPNGDFVASGNNSTSGYIWYFSGQNAANTYYVTLSGFLSGTQIGLMVTALGALVLVYQSAANTLTFAKYSAPSLTNQPTLLNSVNVTASGLSASTPILAVAVGGYFGVMPLGTSANQAFTGYINGINVRSFLGVAAAAPAGGSVTVNLYGTQTLTRFSLSKTYTCNFQGANPPGQAATLAGNSAFLYGLGPNLSVKTQIN